MYQIRGTYELNVAICSNSIERAKSRYGKLACCKFHPKNRIHYTCRYWRTSCPTASTRYEFVQSILTFNDLSHIISYIRPWHQDSTPSLSKRSFRMDDPDMIRPKWSPHRGPLIAFSIFRISRIPMNLHK